MFKTCLVLAALLAAAVQSMVGQTYSCRPATSNATTVLRDYVIRLTGDPTLTQQRALYQLPLVSSSNVQVVTQTKTCQVVVIKVGSTRYVVLDPQEKEGEYEITVIFDTSFQPLASFNS